MNELAYAIDALSERIGVNKIAIAAINKQIEEPIVLKDVDSKVKWACGKCGHIVESCLKYCDRCGQKIDWRGMRD